MPLWYLPAMWRKASGWRAAQVCGTKHACMSGWIWGIWNSMTIFDHVWLSLPQERRKPLCLYSETKIHLFILLLFFNSLLSFIAESLLCLLLFVSCLVSSSQAPHWGAMQGMHSAARSCSAPWEQVLCLLLSLCKYCLSPILHLV